MKLKKKLPDDRSLDQLINHYQVEKAIADRIKASDREERKLIYATMYDELFSLVPDHPRLRKRQSKDLSNYANKRKMDTLRPFLDRSAVFAEFGAGDCRFSRHIAKFVDQVYGIDISDQRNPDDHFPDNFEFIIYDGERINKIANKSIDIAFSDYLIEHLHPEETFSHFVLVHGLLKDTGKYVFRTPHAFTGPGDISGHFSDTPQGFHLKEWTYTELSKLIDEAGFSKIEIYWEVKNIKIKIPKDIVFMTEIKIGKLPVRLKRPLSKVAFPKILCSISK